jgi:hypothetical protein
MSTDTSTSAPAVDGDALLNEIINATGAAVAHDVDNAPVLFRADGEGVRRVAIASRTPSEPPR